MMNGQTKLDLLLINPANQKQIYQSLSTSMTAIEMVQLIKQL